MTSPCGHQTIVLVTGLGTRYREMSRSDANVLMRCENRRGPLAIGRLIEDMGFAPGFALASGLADYVHWSRPMPSAI